MLVEIDTFSVLFALIPAAFVLSSVSPDEFARTMPLVFLELAKVLFTVRPNQVALSVHFVVKPSALILLVVAPDVGAFALNLIHFKMSLVN